MTVVETIAVGKDGDVSIPLTIQQVAGIRQGSLVTLEAQEGTIVIRPVLDDTEIYSSERKAEFLLNNAVGRADYEAACAAVRALGLEAELPEE